MDDFTGVLGLVGLQNLHPFLDLVGAVPVGPNPCAHQTIAAVEFDSISLDVQSEFLGVEACGQATELQVVFEWLGVHINFRFHYGKKQNYFCLKCLWSHSVVHSM